MTPNGPAESRFLGDTVASYFLYVVGEPVPSHEEWMKTHHVGRVRWARPAKTLARRAALPRTGYGATRRNPSAEARDPPPSGDSLEASHQ